MRNNYYQPQPQPMMQQLPNPSPSRFPHGPSNQNLLSPPQPGHRMSNSSMYTPPIGSQRTSNAGVVVQDQTRPIVTTDINLTFSQGDRGRQGQELVGLQEGCNWLTHRNAEMERRIAELERQRGIAYAPVYLPLGGPAEFISPHPLGPPTQQEAEKTEKAAEPVWKNVNENAYGAFIHQAFHNHEKGVLSQESAIRQYGSMIALSFLCQICFAFELWLELPKTRDPSLCSTSPYLQLAAVFIYILVTFDNIPKMVKAGAICLVCKEYKDMDTNKVYKTPHLGISRRTLMFIFAVLSEALAWGAILAVGMIFLMTATTHDKIIRSAVAIKFVQNIDEFIYSGCITEARAAEHRKYKYKLWPTRPGGLRDHLAVLREHGMLYLQIGIAMGIVWGVRSSDVQCDPY